MCVLRQIKPHEKLWICNSVTDLWIDEAFIIKPSKGSPRCLYYWAVLGWAVLSLRVYYISQHVSTLCNNTINYYGCWLLEVTRQSHLWYDKCSAKPHSHFYLLYLSVCGIYGASVKAFWKYVIFMFEQCPICLLWTVDKDCVCCQSWESDSWSSDYELTLFECSEDIKHIDISSDTARKSSSAHNLSLMSWSHSQSTSSGSGESCQYIQLALLKEGVALTPTFTPLLL